MRAIFLDRDGVINVERADYVKSWEEFVFLPGSLDAIRRLSSGPWLLIVITNQSCIGRGIVPASVIEAIHRRMLGEIEAAAGRVDGLFMCPHHPDEGCDCRKPQPGMLRQAAERFDLDMGQSLFIGDSVTDFQAARAAGCRSLLVRSGRQGARLPELLGAERDVTIVPDLAAAAEVALAWMAEPDGP